MKEREFYSIKIPDSIKEKILEIASLESTFEITVDSLNNNVIVDDLPYYFRFICDTLVKEIAYLPHLSNSPQKELNDIIWQIIEHGNFISRPILDLKDFEEMAENAVKKYAPPPPIRSTIKFTPPPPIED